MTTGCELLTTQEMTEADRLAAESGVPALVLMENAGAAIAEVAAEMLGDGGRVAILCGPGNNGGDGFVAARLLMAAGYDVRLGLLGPVSALRGDAGIMAARWTGDVHPISASLVEGATLIIDALFGAGLNRPLVGEAASAVELVKAADVQVLAVDVPSGLDGTTGAATGPVVVQATRTVTFFRRKPGHLLEPGRALCGLVVVSDIGLPAKVLATIRPQISANAPALWRSAMPQPGAGGHKYTRGHAVVVSGPPESTGAARLGARAALRAGAGLVTVASPLLAFPVNAAHLTAIMIAPFDAPRGLQDVLADTRRNAVLIGPGAGVSAATRRMVEIALGSKAAAVLDADALTSFATADAEAESRQSFGFLARSKIEGPADGSPDALFAMIAARAPNSVVLTPHEGEFKRLFGSSPAALSKVDRTRDAARRSGAIVILKGADTVIAAPDGRAIINENAPPWLATAGSGDVLAGFVAGLAAQAMPLFEAAAAAVWLHGECAREFGIGLIAEDLSEMLPRVLQRLLPSGAA
jgi:hydroxyethylthiazole kinase-like uncharacterized protein yjeF